MPRVPPGIQLGRTRTRTLLRALTGAAVLGLLVAAGGAFEVWRQREALGTLRTAGIEPDRAGAVADRDPGFVRSREAATLLLAGAGRVARFGAALDAVTSAASADLRITGIELRPGGETGGVEASVAAEAPSSAGVAAFLASLAGMEAVRSTGEIQEARTSTGFVSVRVTVRLAPQSPSEGRLPDGAAATPDRSGGP